MRVAIENHAVPRDGAMDPLRCTVTIGVSLPFSTAEGLDIALQQADAALYRGKAGGATALKTRRPIRIAPWPLPCRKEVLP